MGSLVNALVTALIGQISPASVMELLGGLS